VINKNNITIIDDTYNANLTSSLASLDYLKNFSTNGRKIFVFGDMYELGKSTKIQHRQVGLKCIELSLDLVFTLGEHTKNTNSALSGGIKNQHFSSKENLILTLKNELQSGDIILLKGSRGMAMETIIEGIFKI
jgi:UDP-N-acetylmuramoyl-tripeptide--D-alanyl-D-alanine ligase